MKFQITGAGWRVGAVRGWKFLSLPDCRKLWEARFGAEWPWHREVSEWQVRRREWHG